MNRLIFVLCAEKGKRSRNLPIEKKGGKRYNKSVFGRYKLGRLYMEARELLFSDLLTEMAMKCPAAPALTCEGKTMSYGELKVMADRCSVQLIKAGVKRGDRVALWGFNCTPWVVAFLGIVGAGAVAVLMNYGLKSEDESALMKSTGANWLIIGPNTISLRSPEEAVKTGVLAGIPQDHILKDSDLIKACMAMEGPALSPEDAAHLRAVRSEMNPHDTQVIIFTTGTTSFPKAPQLSSYSVINDALSAGTIIFPSEGLEPTPFLLALPLFHSYGLCVMFATLAKGMHIFLPVVLKPDTINDLINENNILDMASVGAVYGMMTQRPDFDIKVAGKMRYCIVGGGFETPMKMMRLENAFCGAKIINGYGQTECSPIISLASGADPLEKRAVSVGRPIPGLDVRIWRADKGFLPQGDVGEVVVKGFSLMNGYLNLPPEKQAIDADGWLHTGDIGRFDEEGMLILTGRIKDIIIRCGENISPSDVEKAILEDENITEVKVLGAPHPVWGESVEACIAVKDESAFSEEGLKKRLKEKISSFKVPSHFFLYPKFPLNQNGKLDQRTLKADMLQRLMALNIRQALDDGMRILSLTLRNQAYTIYPACAFVSGIADQYKFSDRQIKRVRLAVEEMLTERINNAYESGGNIRLDVVLMPQWLRFTFADNGKKYRLEDVENSLSAKIILANVDSYSVDTAADGKVEYHLDFQYADDFDVKEYIVRNTRAK